MAKQATFADRLKDALDLRGITKADLSRMTGLSKSSLTHYEKGDWEGKQDAVYRIAKALNVSESWLMGFDVPPDRVPQPKKDQPPANGGLSEEETMLIEAFRALPADERQHVLSLLRLAAGQDQKDPASV